VHSGELATRASNFADALSTRPTTPGIERGVRREAARAKRVATLLHELKTADLDSAGPLEDKLKHEGDCP
jgi:hypothetical protein